MIGHLVRAQLWRVRWVLLNAAFLGAAGAIQSTPAGGRMMSAMALMLTATSLTTLGLFWSREVRVLPITPDIALRSAWYVAMLFPAAIMMGRLLVLVISALAGWGSEVTLEAIALTAVFDAVYVGTSVLIAQQPGEPWLGFRQLMYLRAALGMLGHIIWIALPFAWPELVPRALADVSWLHVAAVLAGLTATVWPVLVTGNQWPTLGILFERRADTVAPQPAKRSDRWLDRLQGISRLLPGQMLGALIVSLLSVGFFVVLSARLQRGIRSPFDAGLSDLEFLLIGGPLVLMMFGPIGLRTGLTPFLRRLRAMPISAPRLILTLTLLPLITPLLFWMVSAVAHSVIGASGPAVWRPGVLLFLCGVLALGSAFVTRFNSRVINMAAGFLPFAGVMTLMMFLDKTDIEPVIAVLFPAVGLAALSAAYLLNHYTITRASSQAAVYRLPMMPHHQG